jgi:hypothetical protein
MEQNRSIDRLSNMRALVESNRNTKSNSGWGRGKTKPLFTPAHSCVQK